MTCLCPFQKPAIAIAENCPIHGKNDLHAQIQSLQQQNAEQAARIEMLMQSSDEKFNEKVGWYSDLKTRISELEKQLKEAQEKG
jgi:predicted nuclease with TOPRIM domain